MKYKPARMIAVICIAAICFTSISTFSLAQKPSSKETTKFHDDLNFLKRHTPIVLLENSNGAAIAVASDYQGRVMTSTIDSTHGPSFGWINRPVIAAGLLSEEDKKGKLEEHIYIFGGEERFWLGPEGGQYSLFFKPGTKFVFDDWVTPPAIDTDVYKLADSKQSSARFTHQCELMNHSGTEFQVGIERTVTLLPNDAIQDLIDGDLPDGLKFVAYETDNRVTNLGEQAWKPETGLISIWMLGMYNPSPNTTVVIPFKQGDESELGQKVNDAYFGKVPPEYLQVKEKVLFLRGDGTRRGKIGIGPQRAQGIAGSYDADGGVLTFVTYNEQPAPNGFVNSMWKIQKEPYAGDLINAYNDGSPAPGKPPLGPFYELETSSPAAALGPSETMKHVQRTWHLQGTESVLDPIAKKLLGVGIEEIKTSFDQQ